MSKKVIKEKVLRQLDDAEVAEAGLEVVRCNRHLAALELEKKSIMVGLKRRADDVKLALSYHEASVETRTTRVEVDAYAEINAAGTHMIITRADDGTELRSRQLTPEERESERQLNVPIEEPSFSGSKTEDLLPGAIVVEELAMNMVADGLLPRVDVVNAISANANLTDTQAQLAVTYMVANGVIVEEGESLGLGLMPAEYVYVADVPAPKKEIIVEFKKDSDGDYAGRDYLIHKMDGKWTCSYMGNAIGSAAKLKDAKAVCSTHATGLGA